RPLRPGPGAVTPRPTRAPCRPRGRRTGRMVEGSAVGEGVVHTTLPVADHVLLGYTRLDQVDAIVDNCRANPSTDGTATETQHGHGDDQHQACAGRTAKRRFRAGRTRWMIGTTGERFLAGTGNHAASTFHTRLRSPACPTSHRDPPRPG